MIYNGRIILCFFLLSSMLFSQDEMKIRVQILEKQVRELTEEVLKLRSSLENQEKTTEKILQEKNHPPSKLYEELIASFHNENKENELYTFYRSLIHSEISIGGYLETQFQAQESKEEESSLDLSSFGFQLKSSWNTVFSVDTEIKISRPESIEIIHAYLLASINDYLNFKVGVIRVPLGRYNLLYSPPAQSLGAKPFFYEFFLPAVWSEPGISLSGEWTEGIPFHIRYEMLLSNGLGKESFQGFIGNQEAIQGLHEDNNTDKQLTSRIEVSPQFSVDILGLYFGISGTIGKYDEENKEQYKGISLDLFLRVGPFSLIGDYDRLEFSAEYIRFSVERSKETLDKFPNTASSIEGIYYQIDYLFFPQEWRSNSFLFGEKSTFALALRYEKIRVHASPFTETQVCTIGFHFRPKEQMVFRVEYSFIEEIIQSKSDWNNRFLASFATFF